MRWVGGGTGAVINEQDGENVVLEGHEIGKKESVAVGTRTPWTVVSLTSSCYGTLGPRLGQIHIQPGSLPKLFKLLYK